MTPYTQYKESGVEWIGEIPAHWEVKRVKYISNINQNNLTEQTAPDYQFYYVDIGNVSPGKISNNLVRMRFENAPSRARRIIKKGDVIVSTVRTYLKAISHVELDGDEFIASTGFAVLSPKFLHHRYFTYLMMCEKIVDTICSLSVGVSYPAVNATDIANIAVWYPQDMMEQTAIATYLDRKTAQIDTLITKKQRLTELLGEERTAIISHAVTKGLDATVPLKDSGVEWIGEIPAHWEVIRLKSLVVGKLKYGANATTELTDRALPRYIRITDFGEDGNLRDDTFRSMAWEIANEYLLEEGDILFARSGATVGKTFLFKNYDGVACFAGYLIKAKPNRSDMISDFLYYFTKSNAYENWKNSVFIQATIQNIGADKYQNLALTVPPLAEQTAIATYLDEKTAQIDALMTKTEKQVELLQEYRTALISSVVTGKVDVREEVM